MVIPKRMHASVEPLPPTLFEAGQVCARVLQAGEVPLVQTLFDENPEYFQSVNGRNAHFNEARLEFEERPPPHLVYSRQWFLGLFDRSRELVGVAVVTSDLCAKGVWHLALFLLASRLHNTGIAGPLYAALEAWAARSGAAWLRLGVVKGNAKAERFWSKNGFEEVRTRPGVETGGRLNDVRVLVKTLRGESIRTYLALVPRDHPGSDLP